jgi:hypothetical protein
MGARVSRLSWVALSVVMRSPEEIFDWEGGYGYGRYREGLGRVEGLWVEGLCEEGLCEEGLWEDGLWDGLL